MIETTNTLVIEDLLMQQKQGDYTVKLECILESRLEFRCSVNGLIGKTIEMQSKGEAYDEEAAAKEAIQNFLNGNSYFNTNIFDVKITSVASHKIHHLDVRLPQPLKQFFEDLFDKSKWDIPNKYIEQK